jgi:DNA-binding SARP family transcriptional activator
VEARARKEVGRLEGASIECGILGPVNARRDGRDIPLSGAKQRTVLAGLALARGHIVADSRLSDLLWGAYPPATSNAQIYTYVSRLRRAFRRDVEILRRFPGYVLYADSTVFDFIEFETTAAAGQKALDEGRYAQAETFLEDALGYWRGPALADVSQYLVDSEGPRLEEARIAVVESRIEANLAMGRHGRLLAELIHLVRQYPLRERFRAQLMTSLYRCDRQADALVLYDEGRRLLADQLGVYPGVLLREVHRAILTEDPRLRAPRMAVST